MPIVWRYLLRSYFQVFLLTLTGFLAVLFVMRFKDIAEFACLNADGRSIFLFSLYQIPYVLPEAIPVSCLIATTLLFQKMSHSQELTALRAAGMGLKTILFPLLLAGVFLSFVSFTVVSELAPRAKFMSKELSYRMTASNPFFLVNKIAEGKLTNAYIDMHALRGGKKAKDVLLIMNNRSNGRLGVMTAKELTLEGEILSGKDVSIISSVDSKIDSFDHLVIENQESMTTKASHLSQLLRDADWHMGLDYLPLRMILAKSHKKPSAAYLEIARRVSISLSPLLFTLLGAAFGIEIGRKESKRGILLAALLSAFFLCCFVSAKSMRHMPIGAYAVYFLPFVLIIFLSLRSLRRISKGVV